MISQHFPSQITPYYFFDSLKEPFFIFFNSSMENPQMKFDLETEKLSTFYLY
jgi:hypothetical protein